MTEFITYFFLHLQVNIEDVELLFDWIMEQDKVIQAKPKVFDSNTIQPEIEKAKVYMIYNKILLVLFNCL